MDSTKLKDLGHFTAIKQKKERLSEDTSLSLVKIYHKQLSAVYVF